jgi:hypothetical protein
MRRVLGALAASSALVAVPACASTSAAAGGQHPAAQPVPVSQLASALQKDVAKVWPDSGSIWPGVDFAHDVLLVTDGTSTWAVNATSSRPVPMDELDRAKVSIPLPGGFDVITWQGKDAVIVRPPTGAAADKLAQDPTGLTSPTVGQYTFELATHEMFHPYVQRSKTAPWTSLQKLDAQGTASRDAPFPLQVAPRIDRAMIYNSLLTALQQPAQRGQDLAAAAYWNDKWTHDYPDEAKSTVQVDLLEGTAKYFERVAVAMAAVGQPGNSQQVRHYLAGTLKPMKIASAGVEPYAIGTVALLNADAEHLDIEQTLTTDPVTPLSLLLKGVNPARTQQAPADVTKGIQNSVQKTNKDLAPSINPFVAAIQDKNNTVLMLPINAVSGSVGGKGFYTTEQLPITITPDAQAVFKTPTGTVTVNKATIGEIGQGGTGYFALPLTPGGVSADLKGHRLTLAGDHLTGTVSVQAKTNDGQQVLYAM